MGYLTQQLEKVAEVVIDKTPYGTPYVRPARPGDILGGEDVGNFVGGSIAAIGAAPAYYYGKHLFKNKLKADKAFNHVTNMDAESFAKTLIDKTGGDKGWLAKLLTKKDGRTLNTLGEGFKEGILTGAGFKNLKLLGKLKALGLISAPFAIGGLVDAAID